MKKRIVPIVTGVIMLMQSMSALAYGDITSKALREKQLEFASRYEYRKGDFDKSFDLYPGIIYTSGIEYTKDGKAYECPAIYMDEHAELVGDYDLSETGLNINGSYRKGVLYNSRLLIPAEIFKEVGCEVATDMTSYVTTISKDGTVLEILPNLIGMRKNGADGFYVPLEACARIIDDTLYVPLRAVASEFGLNVAWDSETNTAGIGE